MSQMSVNTKFVVLLAVAFALIGCSNALKGISQINDSVSLKISASTLTLSTPYVKDSSGTLTFSTNKTITDILSVTTSHSDLSVTHSCTEITPSTPCSVSLTYSPTTVENTSATVTMSYRKDGKVETAVANVSLESLSTVPLTSTYWEEIYNGFGSTQLNGSDIRLTPAVAPDAFTTHAALVNLRKEVSKDLRNFDLEIEYTNIQQLRSGPNPWEVFWVFFNYVPTTGVQKETNYYILKPNGVELGRAYNSVDQEFLFTTGTPTDTIGVRQTLRIVKVDNNMKAYINGALATDYTSTFSTPEKYIYNNDGTIGLYSEDADVIIHSVKISPAL